MPTSKADSVYQSIRALIADMNPHDRLPNFNDMRSELRVSAVTLDRALGMAEEHGLVVRQQGKGIFVAPHVRLKTVGIYMGIDPFGANHSPVWRGITDQLRDCCAADEFETHLFLDPPTTAPVNVVRQQLTNEFAAGRLQGVIYLCGTGPEQFDWLMGLKIPMVAHHPNRQSHTASVVLDEPALIRMGVQSLAEQGCKRIGLLSHFCVEDAKQSAGKLEQFQAALAEHGLVYDPAWSAHCVRTRAQWNAPNAQSYKELGYDAVFNLLSPLPAKSPARPDGLLSLDDMLTSGAMAALNRLDIRPGVDLAVATLANKDSSSLLGYEHQLTFLEYDPAETARTMHAMLMELIAGRKLASNIAYIEPLARTPIRSETASSVEAG